ncbi:MAG: glycine betaine ABC transporter substrate-binding protein [Solirubrobacteraceae bacterium]
MPLRPSLPAARALLALGGLLVTLAGCGGSTTTPDTPSHKTTASAPNALPGTGKPVVTIGDKNFTEQFILGELYYLALRNQGFPVTLNQNIGPLEVTLQELHTGQLAMYPEYLGTWDSQVARLKGRFGSRQAAYRAGQRYAAAHGFKLLHTTPFSDTGAIGVTFEYAAQNGLESVGDLRKLGHHVTLGGPPQYETEPGGLRMLESGYGFKPQAYKSLEIGNQYKALDSREVQAADVTTTDGALSTGSYTLLSDPLGVFGWGNVVPVVSMKALAMEGPAFATTINEVSSLLTTAVIRDLNAQVDLAGQDPRVVAGQFLAENGLG